MMPDADLIPNIDDSKSGFTLSAGANAWELLDDDPAAPTADNILNAAEAVATVDLGLTSLPAAAISTDPVTTVSIDIVLAGPPEGPDGAANYVTITIDNTKIDATLTDYVLYVDLADMPAGFWSTVASDGGDIRPTLTDNTTELPLEIVNINTTTDIGEIYIGVDSVSSSSDTVIHLWYNGTGTLRAATHTYGSQNVWDNAGYVGVWHLNEASSTRSDSTDGGRDLTAINTVGSGTGHIGNNAADISTGDRLERASASLGDLDVTGDFTITALYKLDTDGTRNVTSIGSNSGTSNRQIALQINTLAPDQITATYSDGSNNTLFRVTDTRLDLTWTHFWVAGDVSAQTYKAYIDGTDPTTEGQSGNATSVQNATLDFYIGSSFLTFDGLIDEIRWADSLFPDAWGKAEGLNYMDRGNFYTISAEL